MEQYNKKELQRNNDHTFIIAEMSANHCGSFDLAKKIICAAADCGVDAVKLQTYTADTMTIDCRTDTFKIEGGLWDNWYLYDLYREAATPWEWQQELFDYAAGIGLELFSTPFDATSVDFLEKMRVKRHKIASFEAIDIPFVEYVASTGKPLIISTGLCAEQDIHNILDACDRKGNNDITLLKCTSAYPAPLEQMNLLTIPDMQVRFGVNVGLSDHTMHPETAVAAVALSGIIYKNRKRTNKVLWAVVGAEGFINFLSAVLQAAEKIAIVGLVYRYPGDQGALFGFMLEAD